MVGQSEKEKHSARKFTMIDRQTIINRHPLLDYLHARGIEVRRVGAKMMCCCPIHEDKSPSMSIDEDKGLWNCFAGCGGGSVIDLHAKLRGIDAGAAMRELGPDEDNTPVRTQRPVTANPRASTGQPGIKPKEVCAYDYHDASGRLVYQVIRYEPKTFRQRQVLPDGSFNWSMEGVERVLYRLPDLQRPAPFIFICEGEKDVDTIRAAGMIATCNAGGAKKWLPSYSQTLAGKCIYLIPDNDEPGQEHARTVLKSLEGIVEWVKWIELPKNYNSKPIKDVSDLRAACESDDAFVEALLVFEKTARLIDRGVDIDLYSMVEMESRYSQELGRHSEISLDLRNWMPSLEVRPLIPGDLLGIIAGTGQCKSAAAQNIIANSSDLSTLFFQLEITETLMFERSAAIATGLSAEEIYMKYSRGESVNWKRSGKFKNLLVCPRSGITMKDIDETIARSSAKFGKVPNVFVIDYIQLIRGKGSRYERVSDAAEEAKVLAKKWNCIGVVISQIGRKKVAEGDENQIQEVNLCDGKESGSLENSCGVMLGIWKTTKTELTCRVLKNTKGTGGSEARMVLEGGSFVIRPK